MKNTKRLAQYRQGDVIIERVSALPKGLQVVPRDGGRVILAYGEVTGHAHAFLEKGTQKLTDKVGQEFFKIEGREMDFELTAEREWKNQVMVRHPEFGLIEFAKSDVTVLGKRVVVKGEFALLKHDEHNTQAIPAGFYRGGNAADGKVYQREYSPEEIRRVAD